MIFPALAVQRLAPWCRTDEKPQMRGSVRRTRPGQHHHEARQRASRVADLDLAEVAPVDLGLLTGHRR
ncbi:MAG TPA: hypothetical protein VGC41_12630, partial [Kofleriaceae bacterium]